MPRSTRPMSSSVLGPSGAGWRETLAIRWMGTWPGESAYAQPLDRAVVELGLHVPHRPVELVADEHAVADDVPRPRLDALVVEADGGQAVRLGAVAR